MEIELKLLLPDADAALALLATLGASADPVHQHNLYFDGPERQWAHQGAAVRLRRANGTLILTVKTSGEAQGNYVKRGEWERELRPDRWTQLREGGNLLQAEIERMLAPPEGPGLAPTLASIPLVPVGAMDTLRRRAALPGDGPALLVEVDETTYPNGQQRYEAELEVGPHDDPIAAERRLRECFSRAGLPWLPSHESKRARLERVLAGGRA